MPATIKYKQNDLVKWGSHQDTTIKRHINELMAMLKLGSDGKPFHQNPFKFDIHVKTLSHTIELQDISENEVSRGLIRESIYRLKCAKKQDLYIFRRILAGILRNYLSKAPKKFRILFFLHSQSNALRNCRAFKVLGHKLLIRDWGYIYRHFALKDFHEKNRSPHAVNKYSSTLSGFF